MLHTCTVPMCTVKPLFSSQHLFGNQQPKPQKNCQLYTVMKTATSIKWPWPASCHPNGDFVLFYTAINRQGRFDAGHF